MDSQGRGADVGGHIDGDTAILEILEVFTERRPLDGIADVALPLECPAFHIQVHRAHGRSFAHDFQRDALHDVAHRAAVLDQGFVCPRQHVDEAGRDSHAAGIDIDGAGKIGEVADSLDAITGDGNVCNQRIVTGPVIHRATPDDDVVVAGTAGGQQDGCQHQAGELREQAPHD